MLPDTAFQIDDHQDQSLASDRKSRYGAYLRDKRRLFFHNGPDSPPTADPVEFAVAAWSIATPPIMCPGYVTSHPRIQDTTVHWDDDHRVALAVQIAVPAPPITNRLPSRWSGWVQDGWGPRWRDPHDNDRLTVLSTVTIRVPLNPNLLPDPTYTSGIPDTTCAKTAVAAMCRMINAELTDLLTAMDTPALRKTTSASLRNQERGAHARGVRDRPNTGDKTEPRHHAVLVRSTRSMSTPISRRTVGSLNSI